MVASVLQQGHGAVVFTLEISREEMMRKLLAFHVNVGATNILMSRVDKGVLGEAMQHARKKWPLWIYEHASDLASIWSLTRARQHDAHIGLVVIDYTQNLRAKGSSMFERMSGISQELKAKAKEYGVCILALSQVNHASIRDPNDSLIEFKGGGDLAAASEVSLMLRAIKNAVVPSVQLQIRKNKYGPCGEFDMLWRDNYSGMVEYEA
jgi:replicative DNA helicase